jgi:transcriptional regulator
MSASLRDEIPPGTLDLLILKTLDREDSLHGFQIADSIQGASQNVFQVEEGSLYPALQRMLIKGWITGKWGKTPENRRARFYRLTRDGRTRLQVELSRYERVSAAIVRVLQPA